MPRRSWKAGIEENEQGDRAASHTSFLGLCGGWTEIMRDVGL